MQVIFIQDTEDYGKALFPKWKLINFLIFMVLVEHILLVLKIFIERLIDDVPEDVIRGQAQRKAILDNYHKYKNDKGPKSQ